MTDWPLVIILLLTYGRTEYALRTIKHMKEHLVYPNTKWYVADSGSDDESFQAKMDAIGEENIVSHHHEKMEPGPSWNRATKGILEHTDFLFRLEDDWVLRDTLDLKPAVEMLNTRDDICMVRYGYLHVPADLEAIGHAGIHYLRYKKTLVSAYGGHPALTHKRLYDIYGYFNEGLGPGEIELDYDNKFRSTKGPDSVRPAEIGGWGVFAHVGEKQSYQ